MNLDFLKQKPLSLKDFGTVNGTTQEVRVVRMESRLPANVPLPHRHDFYQIIMVLEGRGWHEIDFCRIPAAPYQVFFTKPGQVHNWKVTSPKASGYIIEFGREAVAQSASLFNPAWSVNQLADHFDLSKVPLARRRLICDFVKIMFDEYERKAPDFEISLRHFLIPLLVYLRRCNKSKQEQVFETDPIVERFIGCVEENFKSEHQVEFYARKLNMTPKAITMRVSRALSKSARLIIHDRCLLEAKRLLAYSTIGVSEIGYELGFEDPNYFSRFFKKNSGLNPKEFRDKAKSF